MMPEREIHFYFRAEIKTMCFYGLPESEAY